MVLDHLVRTVLRHGELKCVVNAQKGVLKIIVCFEIAYLQSESPAVFPADTPPMRFERTEISKPGRSGFGPLRSIRVSCKHSSGKPFLGEGDSKFALMVALGNQPGKV